MIPDNLPKYAILVRWDKFRLDLVGDPKLSWYCHVLDTFLGFGCFS